MSEISVDAVSEETLDGATCDETHLPAPARYTECRRCLDSCRYEDIKNCCGKNRQNVLILSHEIRV